MILTTLLHFLNSILLFCIEVFNELLSGHHSLSLGMVYFLFPSSFVIFSNNTFSCHEKYISHNVDFALK